MYSGGLGSVRLKGARTNTSTKMARSTRRLKLRGKRRDRRSRKRNQTHLVVLREKTRDVAKKTNASLDIDSHASPRALQIIRRNQSLRKIVASGNAQSALHYYPPHSLHLSTRLCGSLIQGQPLIWVPSTRLVFAKSVMTLAASYQPPVLLSPITRSQLV